MTISKGSYHITTDKDKMDIDFIYRFLTRSYWAVIMAQPELQGLRRILLPTRDAHGLYAQFGFTPLTSPERWMQIHHPFVYKH